MIRLLVVDDHPVVREGLVAVLGDQSDFEVVGAVGDAEAALAEATRVQPDVILLDLELPGTDGIAALPALLAAVPNCRVVVFTAYCDEERVVRALRAGARGYLLKGAATAELAKAIRTVHAGDAYLAPGVAAQVVGRLGMNEPPQPTLTEREREVLRRVAEGLPNKQIAAALGITPRTVKFHVSSVMTKLGAENRAHAAALAIQRGLL
jgi:DNA-binding NarL/FixJ family response regulator